MFRGYERCGGGFVANSARKSKKREFSSYK